MEGKSESSESPKEASVYDDPVYQKYKGVLKNAEFVSFFIYTTFPYHLVYRVK